MESSVIFWSRAIFWVVIEMEFFMGNFFPASLNNHFHNWLFVCNDGFMES